MAAPAHTELFDRGTPTPPATVEKVGAGLLLACPDTGDVLLLLRRSMHNDRTWGLPGGNLAPEDGARARPPSPVPCADVGLSTAQAATCGGRRGAKLQRRWGRCRRTRRGRAT